MHPFLTRLGVPLPVQEYFAPYYRADKEGNLIFDYSGAVEKYGLGFHLVPHTGALWFGGDLRASGISQIFISHSAMDAIAFLSLKQHSFLYFDRLLFISTGARITAEQVKSIRDEFNGITISLLFSNDLLGHVTDLKAAAGIRRIPVAVILTEQFFVHIIFRYRQYLFEQTDFSLNAFERAAGVRFNIGTRKPKGAISFLEQLTKRQISSG